jgi:hypothetical protein
MSDTANRALWIVIGAVLTAVGVLGVLVGTGVLPGVDRSAHLLGQPLLDTWREYRAVALAIAGLLGLLAVLVGLRLTLAQFQPRRRLLPDPVLPPDPDGTTRIRAAALERALRRDLERYPAISKATARLTGTPKHASVDVRLDLADDTGLGTVQRHVEGCLTRLRRTYQLPAADLDVTVRPVTEERPRVR